MPYPVIAEMSVTPIGSQTTSVSKQVAEAINAIKSVKGIKFEVNAMEPSSKERILKEFLKQSE